MSGLPMWWWISIVCRARLQFFFFILFSIVLPRKLILKTIFHLNSDHFYFMCNDFLSNEWWRRCNCVKVRIEFKFKGKQNTCPSFEIWSWRLYSTNEPSKENLITFLFKKNQFKINFYFWCLFFSNFLWFGHF